MRVLTRDSTTSVRKSRLRNSLKIAILQMEFYRYDVKMIYDMPPSDVRTKFDIPRNTSIQSLGSAGGFSGAQFWQVETIEETYCLRRWPKEQPSVEQLDWIHRVLIHCAANGAAMVDAPLRTTDGATFVKSDGFVWQLSHWLPGQANYCDEPNDEKLVNAISALAQFHLAAAQVNLDFRPSSNVTERLNMLGRVKDVLRQVVAAPASIHPSLNDLRSLVSAKGEVLAQQLLVQLSPFESTILPIQPVIRDIWHDHIFFIGDEVTGIIDFGAMEMDTVCLDISRLLGSMLGENTEKWKLALASYSGIRALTEPERQLISVLDKSGVLLGCVNWLKWFFLDQREFENMAAVEKRITQLAQRLVGF